MLLEKLNDIINGNDENNTIVIFCRYVKEHIEDIPVMTLDELSKKIYISRGQISKSVRRLGYENYGDFRDACRSVSHSFSRTIKLIAKDEDIVKSGMRILDEAYANIQFMLMHVNKDKVERMFGKMRYAKTVYLFGRGDAHLDCYILENGLSRAGIPCVLCDAEFRNAYHMKEDDVLIFVSVNGDTFHFDKRLIHQLEEGLVEKWLITCRKDLPFAGEHLVLPVKSPQYNQFVMRYFVDLCAQALMD